MAQYTVKKGDSPWSIARDHGLSLKELSDLNGGMDVNKTIYAGQTMNVSKENVSGTNQPQASSQVATTSTQNYTPSYKYKDYTPSDAVNSAQQKKTAAEAAVNNYGDFKYSGQSQLDSMIDKILNREKFSYDLNGDVLYNQYKDQYQALGRTAMADTTAQASALTGGYGNSYATTAGNQAYQQYLTQLNDKIPELYQLALAQYQQEGQDLLNNYNLLSSERQQEYGQYNDKLNRLQSDRDYYGTDYANEYNRDYGRYTNDRDYNTTQYWNDYNAAYQKERDAEADRQYAEQFEYKKQQDAIANQLARDQLNESIRSNKATEAYRSQSSGSNSSGSSTKNLTDTDLKNLIKAGNWKEAIDAYIDQNPDASESTISAKMKALGVTDQQIRAYTGEAPAKTWDDASAVYGLSNIMTKTEFAQRKAANGGKVTDSTGSYSTYSDYLTAKQKEWMTGAKTKKAVRDDFERRRDATFGKRR